MLKQNDKIMRSSESSSIDIYDTRQVQAHESEVLNFKKTQQTAPSVIPKNLNTSNAEIGETKYAEFLDNKLDSLLTRGGDSGKINKEANKPRYQMEKNVNYMKQSMVQHFVKKCKKTKFADLKSEINDLKGCGSFREPFNNDDHEKKLVKDRMQASQSTINRQDPQLKVVINSIYSGKDKFYRGLSENYDSIKSDSIRFHKKQSIHEFPYHCLSGNYDYEAHDPQMSKFNIHLTEKLNPSEINLTDNYQKVSLIDPLISNHHSLIHSLSLKPHAVEIQDSYRVMNYVSSNPGNEQRKIQKNRKISNMQICSQNPQRSEINNENFYGQKNKSEKYVYRLNKQKGENISKNSALIHNHRLLKDLTKPYQDDLNNSFKKHLKHEILFDISSFFCGLQKFIFYNFIKGDSRFKEFLPKTLSNIKNLDIQKLVQDLKGEYDIDRALNKYIGREIGILKDILKVTKIRNQINNLLENPQASNHNTSDIQKVGKTDTIHVKRSHKYSDYHVFNAHVSSGNSPNNTRFLKSDKKREYVIPNNI